MPAPTVNVTQAVTAARATRGAAARRASPYERLASRLGLSRGLTVEVLQDAVGPGTVVLLLAREPRSLLVRTLEEVQRHVRALS